MFLMVLNFGAILGAVFGGWLADHWGAKKVLVLFFILGSVSLILLGLKGNIVFLYILVGIAGVCTIGTQIIANAYVSQYYPAEMRSSGIGWALGVGRLGAIVGPLMGGILLNIHLSTFYNFIAFAIHGFIATICVWIIQENHFIPRSRYVSKKDLSSLEGET